MSKESKYSIDERVVFKENFQSSQHTRRLGGIDTDVTFSQGIGSFNGTSSKILLPNIFNGKSFRFKLSNVIDTSGDIYSIGGVLRITLDNTGKYTINVYDGSARILESTTISDSDEIIITSNLSNAYLYINGNLIDNTVFNGFSYFKDRVTYIGSAYTGDGFTQFDCDLLEIYNTELTTSEVSNLYNNKTYHELPDKIDSDTYKILDVSALKGTIDSKYSDVVNTDVEIRKIGSGIYSMEYNGSTSKLDMGDYDSLIGDKTILAVINPKSFGSSSAGRIIENGRFILIVNDTTTTEALSFTSIGVSFVHSANNSIDLNKYQFIAITRTSTGIINFYINGALSGTANQDSGTPIAGINNITIGNRDASDRAFDGKLPIIEVYDGILSLNQIVQWNSNNSRYFK